MLGITDIIIITVIITLPLGYIIGAAYSFNKRLRLKQLLLETLYLSSSGWICEPAPEIDEPSYWRAPDETRSRPHYEALQRQRILDKVVNLNVPVEAVEQEIE